MLQSLSLLFYSVDFQLFREVTKFWFSYSQESTGVTKPRESVNQNCLLPARNLALILLVWLAGSRLSWLLNVGCLLFCTTPALINPHP